MFKFIDLFCGTGGMSIPFRELGGQCVFACDTDKFARQSYDANFNEHPYSDLTMYYANDIPNHDLLLAGFPCQPFSRAGKQLGLSDGRGQMFAHILRVVKCRMPKAILLENVAALVHFDKGTVLQAMLAELILLGYDVGYKILNSADFGVPQSRRRVYIVALRQCSIHDNTGTRKIEATLHLPCVDYSTVRLGQLLEPSVNSKYTLSDKAWLAHKSHRAKHEAKGNGFGYNLVTSNSDTTSTITARYHKDGKEALLCQAHLGLNPRRLTPREVARLQGFPESYKVVVSDTQAYKQFGNSVTVSVIRAIAERLVPHLGEVT